MQSSFSHTLTFSAAESKKYVIVPVIDDGTFEGTEEFYGHLVPQDGGVSISEHNTTVYITDNDGELTTCVYTTLPVTTLIHFLAVVEIGFTSNSYFVEEGETAVMLIENRSPDMETEVTVRVEFTSGTATGFSHSFVTIY